MPGRIDSTTMLRAIIDSTVDGIALTDLEGNILLSNRPLLRLIQELGIEREGTAVDRLLSIKDKVVDSERYAATMERLRANPDLPSEDEFEFTNNRCFIGFTTPVHARDGRTVGRLWTLREVTHERELERLKDEFVATVSHELRTPLTSMKGFLEMLREGEAGPLTPEQERFLTIVQRSTERLQRLVGDLLFVARLDARGLQLDLGRVRLDELAAECVESHGALARSRDVALILDRADAVELTGDPERLSQATGNLISNALKFTPAGGTVAVRVFSEDGRAILEVDDSGIGIPPDEQQRLFERFFRSVSATEQAIPGTGLGLVITKAIAEAHGGRVSVRSQPGEGSCFRVELPLDG
ncbi:MAG: hypothetical protein JO186_03105 [Actinobacteria bacterium]|nr:hypothetical protein [Actinomycetota bacterium]MBV8395487.1 hypothetical protein [Actinomycetota bacterium]MBV8597210.1 hypothetical protein [Actinomycetota bacterium]